MSDILTATFVRALLLYDPLTGDFFKRSKKGKLVQIALAVDKFGRRQIVFGTKHYKAHRVAWLYMTGELPANHVDHIDGDASNNAFTNLRLATNKENMQNRKGHTVANKLGFLGVCPNGQNGKFTAQITVQGKKLHLGTFDTPEEAHEAYLDAKRKFHPFNTM